MFKSIKGKIVVPAILILVISVIAADYVSSIRMQKVLKERLVDRFMDTSIEKVKAQVGEIIGPAVETSLFLARDPAVRQWIRGNEDDNELGNLIKDRLALLKVDMGYFTSFIVSDTTRHYWSDGHTLLDTISEDDSDDSWYFEAIKMPTDYVLNLDYNQELGGTYLFVNAIIKDHRLTLGVAGVGLQVNELSSDFQNIDITEHSTVDLINQAGKILVSSREDIVGENIDMAMHSDIVEMLASSRQRGKNEFETGRTSFEGNDTSLEVAWERIPGTSYELLITAPTEELTGFISSVQHFMTFSLILAVLATSILLFFIAEAIVRPIKRVAGALDQLAEGDLDVELPSLVAKDEIGTLVKAMQAMTSSLRKRVDVVDSFAHQDFSVAVEVLSQKDALGRALVQMKRDLNDVLRQVSVSSEEVRGGADQVAQSSQSLSQGATEQASSVEEISSSVNEIQGQTRQNAEHATEAYSIARKAYEDAEGGNRHVRRLMERMEQMNSSSEEIKKIIKMIDDIAFQINLLALNANVEAARAGKYGKGFAVVADEVRNLAVKSAESVQETTEMVENTVDSIKQGSEAAEATAGQLNAIVEGAGKVADFLEEISQASREQSQALEQIGEGLDQIEEVTQSNTAGAEESASASEELAGQAQHLEDLISRFSLDDLENSENASITPLIEERDKGEDWNV